MDNFGSKLFIYGIYFFIYLPTNLFMKLMKRDEYDYIEVDGWRILT